MPTWICSFCNAAMTVKPALVGQTRPCPKCAVPSVITDAEQIVTEPEPPRASGPSSATMSAVASATAEKIATESLTSSMLAKIVLVIALVLGVLSLVAGFVAGSMADVRIGLAGILSVVIAWPIYTIADESYRSRRLLQEILKRQK